MSDALLESANMLLRKRTDELKACEERLRDAFLQNERLRSEVARVTAERDRLSSRIMHVRRLMMDVMDQLLERV